MLNDYRDPIGGAELYVDRLAEGLRKRGHKVRLFTSDVTAEEYHRKNYGKSLVHYLKRIINIRMLLRIHREISEFQPDIIHAHGIFNEISPIFLLDVGNIPVYMTIHDLNIVAPVSLQHLRNGKNCKKEICSGCNNCVGLAGALYEHLKRSIHRMLLRKIKIFITPSHYLERILKEYGNYQNVTTIYNGVNISTPMPIKYWKRLLYVGRISKDKGIYTLIKLMKKLKIHNPRLFLTIIGQGPEYNNLKMRILRNNLRNIRLINGIIKDKIVTYYRNSSIVIIPSIYPDILPTVALEAMTMGRIIVASDIGGLTELNQFYSNFNLYSNDNILPQLIQSIIDSKPKIVNSELKYIINKFSMKTHLTKLICIYNA